MKKYLFIVSLVFIWSCEEDKLTEPNDNEDSLAVKDTVRFNRLTNLFKNQCYQCHSEEGFSFYGLNLDSFGKEGVFSELFPKIISSPIAKMTWGSKNYLYLNYRGNPRTIYRLDVGLSGATYHGRN